MDKHGEEPEVTQQPVLEGEETELMERAQAWLQQILGAMGVESEVRVLEDRLEIDSTSLSETQKSCLLGFPSVTGSSHAAGEFGSIGITLDALQYLANTLLNLHQPSSRQRSYTLELDGYRQRRQQELHTMALAAVKQVRSSGSEHEFKALSAAERRQLHTFFDAPEYGDLENFSRGKEPDRRLVIRLATPVPTEEAAVASEIIPPT